MPDPILLDAIKEAWNAGFSSAIQALRDIGKESAEAGRDDIAEAIERLAQELEAIKP